ncbi:hypothetical protein [Chondromyces apiculatus]|uniref:Uncharacterized protein n=1 Tax=Chondromyces apiculatus DSM 436 TaxID=1192034 RepID=A0A017T695_9BACT|nr:hypothetical protein [Chondromyces apiculatus]EYF04749.1 Hypothetical protein CAP_4225 [Chondromyces apiculatus DSM 436]
MGRVSEQESKPAEDPPLNTDRLWILLDRQDPGDSPTSASPPRGPAGRTLVVRDGRKILISVPVERGSTLAAPLRIDQLPWSGARLVVRVSSDATPCAACTEEQLLAACAAGDLGAAGIFAAVREGIARCAERQRLEPHHGVARDSGPVTARTHALLLTPPNARVPTGNPRTDGGDMDLILIV